MSVTEQSQNPGVPAVQGIADTTNQGTAGVGVFGCVGLPDTGLSGAPPLSFVGVYGSTVAVTNPAAIGIYGASSSGVGVYGNSPSNVGIKGESLNGTAIYGHSTNGVAVQGETQIADAVNGLCHSNQHAGVAAHNDGGGSGLWAIGTPAGYFVGDIQVTGDVILLGAQKDCAEEFDVPGSTEPGTVMILGDHGSLLASQAAYDKKVAGVISGAGGYRPGLILGRSDSSHKRMPLALIGQVYCKVDAQYGRVEVGDMLTTSPTPGHAMRAADPVRAIGCVIGKALSPLESGQELIPILVTLQ